MRLVLIGLKVRFGQHARAHPPKERQLLLERFRQIGRDADIAAGEMEEAAQVRRSEHGTHLEGRSLAAELSDIGRMSAGDAVELPDAPTLLGAMRIYDTVGTEDGGFAPQRTALTRSGERQQELQIALDSVRREGRSLGTCRFAAAEITKATAGEPFHPLLEAELADVFATIGRELFLAGGDDRAAGITWLRRAIAAAPAQPKLHYWPGRPFTVGFPHEAAVARARAVLRDNGVEP